MPSVASAKEGRRACPERVPAPRDESKDVGNRDRGELGLMIADCGLRTADRLIGL